MGFARRDFPLIGDN